MPLDTTQGRHHPSDPLMPAAVPAAGTVPDRLPFHANVSPFESAAFEEAAARLLFVAERHWPCGWLHGPAGCGKTTLLRRVARELRRAGTDVVLLSLDGVDPEGFWTAIATALGHPRPVVGLAARSAVRGLLAAGAASARPVTLILDDADRGWNSLSNEIESLLRLTDGLIHRPTVLFATASALPTLGLQRRIDLRASLPPITVGETAGYVAHRLTAGGHGPDFSDAAVEELFVRTAGIPAAVNRLADLAIVAAIAADAPTVTAAHIHVAAGDLCDPTDHSVISDSRLLTPVRV